MIVETPDPIESQFPGFDGILKFEDYLHEQDAGSKGCPCGQDEGGTQAVETPLSKPINELTYVIR